MKNSDIRIVGTLVFPEFELLDTFGPLEMFGMYPEEFEIQMLAERLEPIPSSQGPRVVPDALFNADSRPDILLVPGGKGTRREVSNQSLLNTLQICADQIPLVTSVCTGSALLAAAGVLDGYRATTNKNAWQWVTAFGPRVDWIAEARWVRDGKFATSSGVSAGTDMALALIAELLGQSAAEQAADWAEYHWTRNPGDDPFAAKAGLVKKRKAAPD